MNNIILVNPVYKYTLHVLWLPMLNLINALESF